MSDKKLQENFLDKMIAENISVTIFLVNGVKLQGIIKDHDVHGVLLEYKGHSQLVFCHAISTVMPALPNEPRRD